MFATEQTMTGVVGFAILLSEAFRHQGKVDSIFRSSGIHILSHRIHRQDSPHRPDDPNAWMGGEGTPTGEAWLFKVFR